MGGVITVGGEGKPGNEPKSSVIEAFSPPYLFRGVRSVINSVSGSFEQGGSLSVNVSFADSATAVRLISTASVTHFMNSGNNRFLELSFSQNGNNLNVQLPADSVELPEGFYMLFVMVDDVPSIAEILKIEEDGTVGINRWNSGRNQILKVFPNPTAGQVKLELPESASTGALLRIMDLDSRLCLKKVIANTEGQCVLDLSALPAGVYFVALDANGRRWNSKIILIPKE